MRGGSNLIFLHVTIQLSQCHLLRKLFFSHWILAPFQKSVGQKYMSLFLGSHFLSIDLNIIYLSILSYIRLLCEYILKLGGLSPPLFFFLKIGFAILSPLELHINFRISLSVYTKSAGILIEIVLNLQFSLGSHLNNVESSSF